MILGQIANGLVLGSMYALVAIGFTLVLGALHRLNLAHPEMFMLGGFVGVGVANAGLPIWLGLPLAMIVGGIGGLVVERVSFRRLGSEDAEIAAALSSVAVGLIVIDLTHHVWGGEPVPLALGSAAPWTVELLGVRFTQVQILIVLVTFGLMAALHLLLTRTRMGREIRAVADNPGNATLLGIDVRAVTRRVFFISSGLGCIAGFLLALRLGTASSEIGLSFGLKALAVMAIGGMGDLRGAVVGGLAIGVAESLAAHLGLGRLSDLTVWLLLIIVLLVRPQGLFGGPVREVRA